MVNNVSSRTSDRTTISSVCEKAPCSSCECLKQCFYDTFSLKSVIMLQEFATKWSSLLHTYVLFIHIIMKRNEKILLVLYIYIYIYIYISGERMLLQ